MFTFPPDDDLDPMEAMNQDSEDEDEELDGSGMHVLGSDDEDEDEDLNDTATKALLKDEEADALVEAAEGDETVKDGLAELEEMEKAYLSEDEEEEEGASALEEEEM